LASAGRYCSLSLCLAIPTPSSFPDSVCSCYVCVRTSVPPPLAPAPVCTVDRHAPIRVHGLEGLHVARVACGWRHSAAVTDNGRVFSWGWSKYGQLGVGDQK
jgi:hypothetical protein